jgi:hypothetical protein
MHSPPLSTDSSYTWNHRRLNLAEAMTLMAALAVGLAACRIVAIQVFDPNWPPPSDPQAFGVINPPWKLTPESAMDAARRLSPCAVAPLTLTTLALSLKRLPPRRRRTLARRPGTVACLAATAALSIGAWFTFAFMRFTPAYTL